MRKVAGALSLLMALAISLLAGPLYANESQAVKRTVAPSKYDVTKEVTVEGTIQSLVRKPAPGGDHGRAPDGFDRTWHRGRAHW